VSGGVDAHLTAADLSSVSASPLNVRFSGRQDVTSPEVTSSREVTRRSTAPPQSTFIPAIVDQACFDSSSYYRRCASNRSAPSMSVAAAALKRTERASAQSQSAGGLSVYVLAVRIARQANHSAVGLYDPLYVTAPRHAQCNCANTETTGHNGTVCTRKRTFKMQSENDFLCFTLPVK